MSMIVIQCTSMSSNVTPVTVKGFVSQVGHKTTLKRGEQIMLAYKQQESLFFKQVSFCIE